MPDVKMIVIQKPVEGTISVIAPNFPGPSFKGSGTYNLMCGNCGAVLGEKLEGGVVEDIVIQCFACKAFNASRAL